MKSTLLSHKGYHGSIEPSVRDGSLKGNILFIDDIVSYTALTIPDLQHAFVAAVDGYLEECARSGKFPQRPFKGQFNVRIAPQLHQSAVLRAEAEGTSLNNVVVRALKTYLQDQLVDRAQSESLGPERDQHTTHDRSANTSQSQIEAQAA